MDNHNHGDVLATNSARDLLLFSGSGRGTMTGPSHLSRGGWGGVDLVTIVGDWDGDGAVDIVARKVSTGQLLLYSGNGLGALRGGRVIGTGWGIVNALVAPGDWSGDGRPDLLGRTRDGKLHLYPGNGRGGFGAARVVGSGWSGMTKISALGDWSGDGHVDLIAVDRAGVARIFPGAGAGRSLAPRVIGPGWEAYVSISALGDETSDTRTDLLVVDKGGNATIGKMGRTVNSVVWLTPSAGWGGVSVYTG
ncbi:MAG TPA: VCBS repeat-containing protein [Dermatophilaceae bacterium]